MTEKVELCGVADIAPGAALKVETHGLALAVLNVDGKYYVMNDTCTHGPGSLSEGYIEGDVVECNFHNGQFNIRTDEVVLPPCMIPAKTYPATVEAARAASRCDLPRRWARGTGIGRHGPQLFIRDLPALPAPRNDAF